MKVSVKKTMKWIASLGASLCVPFSSFAGSVGTDYPWDSFLGTISKDLSGNVALGIGIIAVVGCGLAMAFADLQQGGKMAVRVGLGLSVALAANAIIHKLFSGAGALLH